MIVNEDKTREKLAKHEKLWDNPVSAERLVTFGFSVDPAKKFNLIDAMNDPAVALDYSLAKLKPALEADDDTIPMIRVQFGTVLVASAYGAQINIRENNLPAVKNHPIASLEDFEKVKSPDPQKGGWFPKAYEFIEYFKQNMPAGIKLSQLDMQGPWNTAQLLAGENIFYNVYDNPDLICAMLDSITDFMIEAIPAMKKTIGEPWECFYLQGSKIPGASRLVNCSTDMISADTYAKYVFPRDFRFMEAMGGGMIHICGNNPHCIEHFNKIDKLNGLEIAFNYLDVFKVADMLREDIVLICTGPVEFPLLTPLGKATLEKFYKGYFPDKRNILFHFDDPVDIDKCRKLYDSVHSSNK